MRMTLCTCCSSSIGYYKAVWREARAAVQHTPCQSPIGPAPVCHVCMLCANWLGAGCSGAAARTQGMRQDRYGGAPASSGTAIQAVWRDARAAVEHTPCQSPVGPAPVCHVCMPCANWLGAGRSGAAARARSMRQDRYGGAPASSGTATQAVWRDARAAVEHTPCQSPVGPAPVYHVCMPCANWLGAGRSGAAARAMCVIQDISRV